MPGWVSQRAEWEFVETSSSIEGTKAFMEIATGTDDLPDIGDAWSTSFPNVRLRSRRRKKVHVESGVDKEKVVCRFSTRAATSGVISPDEEERRFQLGAEVLSIDTPSNWKWSLANNALTQPVFLSNIIGSFTRQRILSSDATKAQFIKEKLLIQAGTINSQAFEDFPKGSVLFDGVTGGTQSDESGEITWVFDLNFSWRIIRGGATVLGTNGNLFPMAYDGNAIEDDYWLWTWNENASASGQGFWDKPTGDGAFLYSKTDFGDLFK